ncbi:hypothetical protein [Paenibacillus agricola]|nr:hypothetical protein [Paenibacillus agricola]
MKEHEEAKVYRRVKASKALKGSQNKLSAGEEKRGRKGYSEVQKA